MLHCKPTDRPEETSLESRHREQRFQVSPFVSWCEGKTREDQILNKRSPLCTHQLTAKRENAQTPCTRFPMQQKPDCVANRSIKTKHNHYAWFFSSCPFFAAVTAVIVTFISSQHQYHEAQPEYP